MNKLFVSKKVSKKTGNTYVGLFIDFDYRTALISCDTQLIQDCLKCYGSSYVDFVDSLEVDEKFELK